VEFEEVEIGEVKGWSLEDKTKVDAFGKMMMDLIFWFQKNDCDVSQILLS
jgi:hypothetical protein